MSTSPTEVRKRRNWGPMGALALCLMALGMAGGTAQAAPVNMTLTSHSPTHYPQAGSTQVPVNMAITLNFNGPVKDLGSAGFLGSNGMTAPDIQLTPSVGANGVDLGLSTSVSGNTITVNHSVPFDVATFYVVTVKGIQTSDTTNFISIPAGTLVPVSGNASNPFTFRTFDNTAPYIDNHNPTNNDNPNVGPGGAIAATGNIQIVFNKPVADSSGNNTIVANTSITATKFDGTTVDLKPLSVFTFDVSGTTLTISPKKDSNGNPIPWPGSKSDAQPTRITVTVGGNDLFNFMPLQNNPNGVNATNQNPFTFRVQDTIPPALQSSNPGPGAIGVDPLAPITLHFDEPIDCNPADMTVQTQANPQIVATFLVYQVNPGNSGDVSGVLPGTISAACTDAQTVVLNHSATFASNTLIGVRVLGENNKDTRANSTDYALQDVHGNRLANSTTFTFGIKNAVPPAVTSSTPAPGQGLPAGYLAAYPNPVDPFQLGPPPDPNILNANRVSPTAPIVINFSESINTATFATELRERVPGKVNDSDFPLVSTTVSWSNNNTTATITPTNPLDAGDNAIFQLRLITATDLSGNPLAVGSIPGNLLIFRTQDLTGPAVATLVPTNGATVQPTDTNVQITMTEPIKMDGSAIISIRDARPADDPTVIPLPVLANGNADQGVFSSSTASRTVLFQIPVADITSTQVGGVTVSKINLTFRNDLFIDPLTGVISVADATHPANAVFPPGETLIFQITQASDLNGNNIRQTPTNPWIYNVNDTRPPRVSRVRVGGVTIDDSATGNQTAGCAACGTGGAAVPSSFPLVGLNAPVEVTFTKPLGTNAFAPAQAGPPVVPAVANQLLVFMADGDWSSSASLWDPAGRMPIPTSRNANGQLIVTATGAVVDTTQVHSWVANASSYSADLRTVTLTHAPFPEANPNDMNVADDRPAPGAGLPVVPNGPLPSGTATGDFEAHNFDIVNATDQNGQTLQDPNSNPANQVRRTGDNVPVDTDYITSSLPRITDVQFEIPAAGGTPDNNGLLDPDTTKRQWVSFSALGGIANQLAVVPLNSRFKFVFSSQMNQSTVPPPIGGPTLAHGWTATWSADSFSVVWDHADLLPSPPAYQYLRNPAQTSILGQSGAEFTNFRLGSAADFKGDTLGGDAPTARGVALITPTIGTNMDPIDVTPPSMTVQYLANIKSNGHLCDSSGNDTTDFTLAVWKNLNGAVDVPLNTVFRAQMNETFGPGRRYKDTRIAFGVSAPGGNKGIFTTGSQPSALTFINSIGGVTTQARQDYSPSSGVVIAGGQTMFSLNNLQGNTGGNGAAQVANTYTLTFVGGDTRLDDNTCTDDTTVTSLGCPANGGLAGSLPGNVGGIPGNQSTFTASFTTENRNPPTVITGGITGSPNLTQETPSGPISVKFDEPVDINTVTLSTISGPSTPTFSKAYGNNGADKTTVVFTPTTPLIKPAIGAPNVYVFQIAKDVKDLFNASGVDVTCNGQNDQGNINLLNGNGTDRFTVLVPVSVVPPAVRSVVSTREEITVQFSEPVNAISDPGNAGYANSVLNPANFVALLGAGQVPFSSAAAVNTPGAVNYQYYNPNRTQLVNGALILAPGFVTATKNIVGERYDANANAVVLQVQPMTEGQGSGQPETVQFQIANGLQDVNTNAITAITETVPVQTGRADWQIQMGATSNVPGASPDANNFFGVFGVAGVGGVAFPGPATPNSDIAKPLAPGANHVYLFSARGNSEPGFSGLGGNYAVDLQSRPGLDEKRVWPNIGVTTDLGATGAPATITLNWNLALMGLEVPVTHAVELINLNPIPGEPTSIDMRSQNTFSYQVSNNGLDQTRFFRLEVTAPGVQQAPFQLSSGFNMVGVPVRAQNPAVGNVFFGLSPLVLYRYNPATGYEIFPVSSNFTTVDPGLGYWVRPNSAGYQISVLGVPVVGQTTLALKKGWNLISDPFLVPVNGANLAIVDSTGLSQSVSAAVTAGLLQDSFTTLDPVAKGYTAPQPLSSGTLQPWVGYWVLAFSDVNLVLNKPTAAGP